MACEMHALEEGWLEGMNAWSQSALIFNLGSTLRGLASLVKLVISDTKAGYVLETWRRELLKSRIIGRGLYPRPPGRGFGLT